MAQNSDYTVLKKHKNDRWVSGPVFGTSEKNRQNRPKIGPKMGKNEVMDEGSRLMNQNSDYTVPKKDKNDRWVSEPVSR